MFSLRTESRAADGGRGTARGGIKVNERERERDVGPTAFPLFAVWVSPRDADLRECAGVALASRVDARLWRSSLLLACATCVVGLMGVRRFADFERARSSLGRSLLDGCCHGVLLI